ncbi:MAG: outer membrane lipoprotein chaperone LolA [Idiomarina sp.]|nr:outer membrane lipoprotein chaperone LolA [Idiomarina sp.]
MYRKLIVATSIVLFSVASSAAVHTAADLAELSGASNAANHTIKGAAEHTLTNTETNTAVNDAATQLQATLSSMQSLSGSFFQEIYDNGELLQELSGNFVLERPAKLRWVTYEPEASELIADGDTLWYYNPFIEQVTLYNQADAMQANPLLVLLDSAANWQGFTITDLGKHEDVTAALSTDQSNAAQSTAEARHYWQISDQQQAGSELFLAFHEDELQQLILDDGQGQVSVFHLSIQQKNEPLSATTFTFNIPPGTDVDDQRE